MERYFKANAVLSVFSKKYMTLKKGLPIRPSELGVLNIITGTQGPNTPVMLAQMLSVSKPMITAHITALERQGYITKSPCAQDKRAYYILPTLKAKELVERARVDQNRQLEGLMNAMGQEQFDTLVRLADVANRYLECEGE